MSVISDGFIFVLSISLCYILFKNSDNQPLPLLGQHNELDALLNGIDWDQPLSPLDLNLPTDPDLITLLSSSSPIFPVVLLDQPPNPLVDKFLQSFAQQIPLSNSQINRQRHGESLESTFYRFHCLAPKLILIKPNRKNHNLILLLQDDTPLIQQLWEHQLKTPEHLYHDQINFREIRKFTNKSGEKVVTGITNLFKGPDTNPFHTTS